MDEATARTKINGMTLVINKIQVSLTVSMDGKDCDAIAHIDTARQGVVSGISYGDRNWMGSAFFDEKLGTGQADSVRKACRAVYDFALTSSMSHMGIFDYRIDVGAHP